MAFHHFAKVNIGEGGAAVWVEPLSHRSHVYALREGGMVSRLFDVRPAKEKGKIEVCELDTDDLAARPKERHLAVAELEMTRRRLLHMSAAMEAHEHQEAHSPTVPDMIKMNVYDSVSGRVIRKEVQQATRRKADARIWGAFSPEQEKAAEQIQAAWSVLAGDVNVRIGGYGSEGGRPLGEDKRVQLVSYYREWANNARKDGFDASAIMEVLCYGAGLREVERSRSRRNGWAKDNLHDGLDRYAELRGWIARKNT